MPHFTVKLSAGGFSLMEILVAIGVVAIISAVAVPNLKDFNKTQEIDGSAQQLANTLKRAQSSAASRIECLPTNASGNWQVTLYTSASNDTYTLGCQGSSPQTLYSVYTSPFAASQTSSTTFQATTVPACPGGESMTIYYSGLQMSYKCANATNPVFGTAVTITLTGGGLTKNVTVDPGGVISVQ